MTKTDRIEAWLKSILPSATLRLIPIAGDASQRRYWRVQGGENNYVVMEDPTGSTERFVQLAKTLKQFGVHAPEIYGEAPGQGFLLMEDLGTQHYLDVLDTNNVNRLYGDALGTLAILQTCLPTEGLPAYDAAFLSRELDLFSTWLLDRYLGLVLSPEEQAVLQQARALLIANALEQPQVFVHRDFHSRNLLVSPSPSPGVLDFQDAVRGPVTYDLVSLLRDCYIEWPRQQVEIWAWGYFQLAVQSGVLRPEQEQQFLRWFDLMGIQRHLKASGIFARLWIRDGKAGHLADIPRTLNYVVAVGVEYSELQPLAQFLATRVLPALRDR